MRRSSDVQPSSYTNISEANFGVTPGVKLAPLLFCEYMYDLHTSKMLLTYIHSGVAVVECTNLLPHSPRQGIVCVCMGG